MKIGWQRILSMALLISALALFGAMHLLRLSRLDGDTRGWEIWQEISELIQDPALLGEGLQVVAIGSFLMLSLLIFTSPFLGKVWTRSYLAWSISVILSGIATGGFWFFIFDQANTDEFILGGWCLIISPVLNFVGLLLARPQWLKRTGPSFPVESQAAA